jgi:hypothetical protein
MSPFQERGKKSQNQINLHLRGFRKTCAYVREGGVGLGS